MIDALESVRYIEENAQSVFVSYCGIVFRFFSNIFPELKNGFFNETLIFVSTDENAVWTKLMRGGGGVSFTGIKYCSVG